MRTKRSAGDNGYRSAEDYANEGRGYERGDNNGSGISSLQTDRDINTAGRPQERGRDRNGYDNGSNLNDVESNEGSNQRSENFGGRYNDFIEDKEENAEQDLTETAGSSADAVSDEEGDGKDAPDDHRYAAATGAMS